MMDSVDFSFGQMLDKYGVRRSYLCMHAVPTPAIQHHETAYLADWCPTESRAHALAVHDDLQVLKPLY